MINPLGPSTPATIAPVKAGGVAQTAPAKSVASPKAAATGASSASTIAKAGPPVDTAKVARVKAGLADGSYQVDAKAIARAMVDHDLPELA